MRFVSSTGRGRGVRHARLAASGAAAVALALSACAAREGTAAPAVRRFAARPATGSSFSSSWYDLFPGGCVTIKVHSQSSLAAIGPGLTHQAMLILGYVRRGALQQALLQRSGGRLHLTWSPPATPPGPPARRASRDSQSNVFGRLRGSPGQRQDRCHRGPARGVLRR
jgi:hypothetical protein